MSDVITTVGKNQVAEMIGGLGSHDIFDILALGTSGTTATAADTTLSAELTGSGLARVASTLSTTTANILQLVHTWTSTGTKTVKECGILDNSTSGGTLLAHSDFTGIALTADDQLQVTYKITVS